MFACGSNGWQFNYADNVLSSDFNYPLYYFAYKRNEPSMLYNEMQLMQKPEYAGSEHCSFMTLALKYALKMDLKREAYYNLRPGLGELGGRIADYSQNSLRWRIFRYNCRQHNTLTVNDKDHDVSAFVKMIATENTPSRMGATFDLTPLFWGDLEKAERTASLCDESYLEIKDVLKAPADRPAHVRWTMLSTAEPQITPDGIMLTRKSITKKLSTSGGNVTYKLWSSNIEDYEDILRVDGAPIEKPVSQNTYICGYEIDIPAGEELILITTLK